MLATGLYFKEQSSTLYTIITAGGAVEVSYSVIGKVVRVYLFNYGKAAGISWLQ